LEKTSLKKAPADNADEGAEKFADQALALFISEKP